MIKKTLNIDGHSTSVALEAEFWQALDKIQQQQNKSRSEIIKEIDHWRLQRKPMPNLASAIRIYILIQHVGGIN